MQLNFPVLVSFKIPTTYKTRADFLFIAFKNAVLCHNVGKSLSVSDDVAKNVKRKNSTGELSEGNR